MGESFFLHLVHTYILLLDTSHLSPREVHTHPSLDPPLALSLSTASRTFCAYRSPNDGGARQECFVPSKSWSATRVFQMASYVSESVRYAFSRERGCVNAVSGLSIVSCTPGPTPTPSTVSTTKPVIVHFNDSTSSSTTGREFPAARKPNDFPSPIELDVLMEGMTGSLVGSGHHEGKAAWLSTSPARVSQSKSPRADVVVLKRLM